MQFDPCGVLCSSLADAAWQAWCSVRFLDPHMKHSKRTTFFLPILYSLAPLLGSLLCDVWLFPSPDGKWSMTWCGLVLSVLLLTIFLVSFVWSFTKRFRATYDERARALKTYETEHGIIAEGLHVRAEIARAARSKDHVAFDAALQLMHAWRSRFHEAKKADPTLPDLVADPAVAMAPETDWQSAREWMAIIDTVCIRIAERWRGRSAIGTGAA